MAAKIVIKKKKKVPPLSDFFHKNFFFFTKEKQNRNQILVYDDPMISKVMEWDEFQYVLYSLLCCVDEVISMMFTHGWMFPCSLDTQSRPWT